MFLLWYATLKNADFLKHLNLAGISERLYSLIQSSYLIPSVFSVWNKHQSELLSNSKNKTLTVGGDGRNNTPGHSAKYGSYSIMDLDTNKILDLKLVQVSFLINSDLLNHYATCPLALKQFIGI